MFVQALGKYLLGKGDGNGDSQRRLSDRPGLILWGVQHWWRAGVEVEGGGGGGRGRDSLCHEACPPTSSIYFMVSSGEEEHELVVRGEETKSESILNCCRQILKGTEELAEWSSAQNKQNCPEMI